MPALRAKLGVPRPGRAEGSAHRRHVNDIPRFRDNRLRLAELFRVGFHDLHRENQVVHEVTVSPAFQEIVAVIVLSAFALTMRSVPSIVKRLFTRPPKIAHKAVAPDLGSLDKRLRATTACAAMHAAASSGDAAKAESLMEEALFRERMQKYHSACGCASLLSEGGETTVASYGVVINALAKAGQNRGCVSVASSTG